MLRLLFFATALSLVAITVQEDEYTRYTRSATGCECWWDVTRTDCACCEDNPDVEQCGYPDHKHCALKSSKGWGCPGVPQRKYTKSTKGSACYWKKDRTLECGLCTDEGYQCGPNKRAGLNSKKGNHCINGRNKRYCDSVMGDCRHIPSMCDPNAECVYYKKLKKRKLYKCQCKDGFTGSGIQCRDADGNFGVDPKEIVKMTMLLNSTYYVYPHNSTLFPVQPGTDTLISAMNDVVSACSNDDCQASLNGN